MEHNSADGASSGVEPDVKINLSSIADVSQPLSPRSSDEPTTPRSPRSPRSLRSSHSPRKSLSEPQPQASSSEPNDVAALKLEVSQLRAEVSELKALMLKQEKRYDETLREHGKLIAQLFKANQQQLDRNEKESSSGSSSTLPSIILPATNTRSMFNQFNVNSLISRRKSLGGSDGDGTAASGQAGVRPFLPEQLDYHQAKEYFFQRAHGTSKWQHARQLGNEVIVENHLVTRISRKGLVRLITQNFGCSEFFELFFVYHEACFEARELLDILFGSLREVTAEIRKVVIFNLGVWANQNPNSFATIANDLEALNAGLITRPESEGSNEVGATTTATTTTTGTGNSSTSATSFEPLQESHDAIKSVLAAFRNREATVAKELKDKLASAPEIALDKKALALLEKAKPNTISFEKIDALEIARQITLMEQAALRKVPFSELVDKRFEKDAPKLRTYAHTVDGLQELVVHELFKMPADQVRKRALMVGHFIEIAGHLSAMQNFSSMATIVSVLSSHPSIRALAKTLKAVSQPAMKKLAELEELVMHLKKPSSHAIPPVMVPITAVMRDLTFIEEVGKTWTKQKKEEESEKPSTDGPSYPLLNFRKMIMVGKTLKIVKDGQDIPFLFKEVLPLQHYIADSIAAAHCIDNGAIQNVIKFEDA